MTSIFSTKDILSHPERLIDAMRTGEIISVPDAGYSVAPTTAIIWADDDDEAGDMVSLTTKRTGIHNTLFASTKGYASERHGPRIKIAIDPAQRNVANAGKSASMALHNYAITGEHMPRALADQVQHFIELNHAALLAYWEGEIATDELFARLRPLD
jgi:hypothetical protein